MPEIGSRGPGDLSDAASQTAAVPGGLARALEWAPSSLFAFGAIVGIAGNDGGYFATTWGPATLIMTAFVAVWLVSGARTDAGRREALVVGLIGAFTAWVALSILWSTAPANSVLEPQRAMVLLSGIGAVLVLARRGTQVHLLAAVVAAATAISAYSLGTRLFPGSAGTFSPIDGYRLSGLVGYWNGLGIFAAMGIVLALGLASETRSRPLKAAAAGALVVLAPTLYFTFSRGGWAGLGIGLAALLVVSPRRMRVLGALVVLVPLPAVAVALSARATALTHANSSLEEATDAGRSLAAILALLVLAASASGLLLATLERRVRVPLLAQRAIGTTLVLALVLAAVGGIVRGGGPAALTDKAIDAFRKTNPPEAEINLNDHLFTFSGSHRFDLWRVAHSTYRTEPILGVGAGSFERYWQIDEDATLKSRDAHNVYLETLAEMGPIGLVLLLALVGAVVVINVGSRAEPGVAAGLGAFAAYAAHAGVDWDWELTGVTLTAFVAGSAGMVAARRRASRRVAAPARWTIAAATVGVGVIAALGYVGNLSLSTAQKALAEDRAADALAAARTAERWSPWSPYPPTVEGEALLLLGDADGAEESFRDAISVDDGYWRSWLGLAVATEGAERERALDRARALYPRSREIYETEQRLRRG